MSHIPEPVNVTEHYLHGINVRLNILIEQVSSLVEALGSAQGLAVEQTKVVEEPVKKKRAPRKKE